VNNFTYRIHKKNVIKTASYRCTKKMSTKCPTIATLDLETNMIVKFHHAYMHTSNILREMAKQEERKMIQAAASVGRMSTVEILSKIKTNLDRSAYPEATSSIRKSSPKVLRHSSTIPKSAKDIKENLPEKFQVTSTGGIFLRHCHFVDDHKKNLMIVFMSDHSAWVPGISTAIFVDGKFNAALEPFCQIYFALGQMGHNKHGIPCVYALLPNKETSTYSKRCGPSSFPMLSLRMASRTWSCRILRRAS
jgi:hypothetical protein